MSTRSTSMADDVFVGLRIDAMKIVGDDAPADWVSASGVRYSDNGLTLESFADSINRPANSVYSKYHKLHKHYGDRIPPTPKRSNGVRGPNKAENLARKENKMSAFLSSK